MMRAVAFDYPAELEERVQPIHPDFDEFARESVAVQLFREGVLSHFELARNLALDRTQTDALLKRYRVEEFNFTHAEIDAEVAGLQRLLNPLR